MSNYLFETRKCGPERIDEDMDTDRFEAVEYDDDFGDDDVIDVTNFALEVDEPFAPEVTFEDDDEDTLVENRPSILQIG